MDVEDAVGERGDEFRGEQTHVAGEADEIDVVFAQAGDQVGVVLGAGAAFGYEDGGAAGRVRAAAAMPGASATLERTMAISTLGRRSFADGFGDGEEVGAAAGEEDSEAEGRTRALRAFILRVGRCGIHG